MIKYCFLLLFILNINIIVNSENNDNNNFPWNGNYESRSKEILELMKNDMSVAFKSDRIPYVIQNGDIIKATNGSGNILEIGIQKEKIEETLKPLQLTSIDSYNILLDGFCTIMLNNFWNYEWCYRKEVRQFHFEHPLPPKTHQTQSNKPIIPKRNPEFSLGKYQRTLLTRSDADPTNTSSPITRIVEYYKDGQRCDENGALRSTEVTIQCCPEMIAVNNKKVQLGAQGNKIFNNMNAKNVKDLRPLTSSDSLPHIKAIHEPALCEYRLTICYEMLCTASNVNEVGLLPLTLVQVIKEIAPMCMTRVEDWWTYELCFSKEVRQFHVETTMTVDKQGRGVEKRQIHQLYSLGHKPFSTLTTSTPTPTPTQSKTTSNNNNNMNSISEETLLELFVPASASLSGKPSLQLEYSDGTECDIEDLKRSTTVELFCSTSGKDEIVNIVEDRTCHYHMQVGIAALCSVPKFEPIITKSVILDFVSLDAKEVKEGATTTTTTTTTSSSLDEIKEQALKQQQEVYIERKREKERQRNKEIEREIEREKKIEIEREREIEREKEREKKIEIEIEIEREREREMEREREREMEREKEIEIEIEREMEREKEIESERKREKVNDDKGMDARSEEKREKEEGLGLDVKSTNPNPSSATERLKWRSSSWQRRKGENEGSEETEGGSSSDPLTDNQEL